GEPLFINPITGIAAFCADAASGQAKVEPTITLMKSRRRIQPRHTNNDYSDLARSITDRGAAVRMRPSVAELLWSGNVYQIAPCRSHVICDEAPVIFRPPCAAQWSSRNRTGFRQDGGSQGLHLRRRLARLPCLLLSEIRP